jgi:hypothetical protein
VGTVLAWLRKGLGTSAGGVGGSLGVLDELFNPGAKRGREEMAREHEMALPAPTPGDRLLTEGRITIRRPAPTDGQSEWTGPATEDRPGREGGGSGI